MLTLAKFAVALAGTALLGSVAAAPAPQVTADAAITTSQDALVPIITVTETYTTHGSLTTATITIYEFSKDHADTVAPHTSSAATIVGVHMPTNSFTTTLREPVPHISAYGRPSSVVDGMPIYTNMPHHHGHGHGHGHKPVLSKIILDTGRPFPETTYNIDTEAYGFSTGMPTRLLTGQLPHETEKVLNNTGMPSVHHGHGVPTTEDNVEAMHSVAPEGTSGR